MANLTATKNLGDIKTLFNKIKEVYYFADADKSPADLSAADMELPVISDGVTYNSGAPDVTKVKLTTGAIWTSMAEAGDADISFQIGTFSNDVVDVFLNKEGAAVTPGFSLEDYNYSAQGYNLEPKKVTCGLLMCSEDKEVLIYMPTVEIYASVVIESGKPGYINAVCSPLASEADGVAMYFLSKGAKVGG